MSETARPQAARPSVLSLNINSKSALYAAYMPFLVNGGLFVPTPKTYQLGDEVFMLLQLMDDPTRHPVAGTVAWVTPQGAQGGKAQGIGVHFSEDESGQVAKRKIETLLAGMLDFPRTTHTY